MATVTNAELTLEQLQSLANDPDAAKELVVSIVQSAASPDEDVRNWAFEALENQGEPTASSLPHLCELTQSPKSEIAFWACRLLGRSSLGSATENAVRRALIASSKQDVREEAARVLGLIEKPSNETISALKQALQSDSPRLIRFAQEALDRLN